MPEGRRAFFTYVWGPPSNPAGPLTFSSKAARTQARRVLTEGDIVFTVCTKGDPSPVDHWSMVVGATCVSSLEVNTADYALPEKRRPPILDSAVRFPFALHPVSVWEITSRKAIFSGLVGPLTPLHHLQAQTTVVELESEAAAALLTLGRRELQIAMPVNELALGRILQKNSKLAPKHAGSFVGAFADHETWFIYTLVLKDKAGKNLAVKIGYSNSPSERETAYNTALANEVTGLRWVVDTQQPASSEDMARDVEQAVLRQHAQHRLGSNGEILKGVDPMTVGVAVAMEMRSRGS